MNTLLATDVYKLGHLLMYPDDTTEIYSYLEARKPGHQVTFFGLQYIIKKFLLGNITPSMAKELYMTYEAVLGVPMPQDAQLKIAALVELGYWPIEIKAIPEGTVVSSQNILMSVRNTKPGFHWCVGFLESLLMKLWYPCTVATASRTYLELVADYAYQTCDDFSHLPYAVHDFGYRGVSSEESAMIAGASHLVNFLGSDTISATSLIYENYYGSKVQLASSVPASEHSVMCAYGRDGEFEAFDRMLELYPTGVVSIVSDSYDYWHALTTWPASRKEKILARDGKVVFRPDSGDPEKIINGDDHGVYGSSAENSGSLNVLWDIFGGTINSKGYRVLNPKVGLIYGDGMYYERFERILKEMKEQGFASSNLVIGVGGLLLQNHNRDEFGFAVKATRIIRAGNKVEVFKDPKTDQTKKSKRGLMMLSRSESGIWSTKDQVDDDVELTGMLKTVYKDGALESYQDFAKIRRTSLEYFNATHVYKLTMPKEFTGETYDE